VGLENLKTLLSGVGAMDYAVPAYNILNHLTLKAVIEECEAGRSPVIIQTSVATVKFYGPEVLALMAKSEIDLAGIPVALHLDHCTDPVLAKKCVDCGWSSIMFDGSGMPFDENISLTKEIADYAHPKGVSVEGELGAIHGVEDHIDVKEEDAHLADVRQSAEFVQKTGIDAFAPAVGTAHGMYKGEPKLDFDRFSEIRSVIGDIPLVVHGGTGLSSEAFDRFIQLGAAKINVSTAIKQSYMKSMRRYAAENEENNPLVFDRYIVDNVRTVVKEHNELFRSVGRIEPYI